MIDIFKTKCQIIVDAMFNHPILFILSIAAVFLCAVLTVLTFYLVGKFEILKYPFLLFIMVLTTEFYINILIWIIKLVK